MGETRVGGGRHEIPKDWHITQLGVGHVQVMRLPQRYDLSYRTHTMTDAASQESIWFSEATQGKTLH